jgi:crescentin
MSSVWERLFKGSAPPANDSTHSSPFEADADAPPVKSASSASAPAAHGRIGETLSRSLRVARTFDSIGRRNESLRAQLDQVEFSFRNIEAIRAQFYETLTPIDQTLLEIERTKIAHLEAERKLEVLTSAHDLLKAERAGLTVERNGFAAKVEESSARIADLDRAASAAETALSEARAALAERTVKLERVERELEDNRRRLLTVTEQLPAVRAEFAAKEKRLQEVEQQRASLHDQHDLLTQENRSLRTRIEEFTANVSKLNRQLNELEGRREDANRRLEELEAAASQEATAHAKLKAVHLDAIETHRLSVSRLKEELGAMNARSQAAERLLAEARAELRERDAAIRGLEQRAVETALAVKSKETAIVDLEKDLASARAMHSEADGVRAALAQRCSELQKALEDRDVALQRAEQKIGTLDAGIAEQSKAIAGEREAFEEKVGKLKEKLEAESAARAFAEGALQAARQDRGARRVNGAEPGSAPAKEAVAGQSEPAREKITRLRDKAAK